MCRVVLTLLVGLMLSLGGGASAFASGEVIWEGTQQSKLFSLTGTKKIRITTQGVFINGRFKPAWQLSKDDACLYGISNFPNSGYFNTSKVWKSALLKFDFSECSSIRSRAKYSYIFKRVFSSRAETIPVKSAKNPNEDLSALNDTLICNAARISGSQQWSNLGYAAEAISRGLDCGISDSVEKFTASGGVLKNIAKSYDVTRKVKTRPQPLSSELEKVSDGVICNAARIPGTSSWLANKYSEEAKRRGLSCGIEVASQTRAPKNVSNDAELLAARKRAAELEERLALLEAKEELVQRQAASDNQAPLLIIIQSGANGREGYLTGSVTDNVEVAEVLVDGTPVSITANGSFAWTGFVPATGKDFVVEAIDTAALSSRKIVRLERSQTLQKGILRFDGLNPLSGKIAQANQNALALIVGISEYDRTNAPAIFADNDAQFFQDYAALKLGIPENNITTLLNADAGQVDVLLSVKNWLARAVKQEQSDVYVFFAGHGLASDDGAEMFLLPYDGAPELLEETTISRQKLFNEIAASNPGSVTVFLDTCYSGTTRGPDMLIASRPIAIRAKEQAVPEGFTVMTAAAGDQTAKPLEEAKHGMFSYFLMKGMEGDADANQDNQITAGELHAYVQQNVIQQSSGSQTPELQGDADRVLVRFQ